MKKTRKVNIGFVPVIIISMILSIALCGCGSNKSIADKLSTVRLEDKTIEAGKELPIITSGSYALYLDKDMTVRIKDSSTGDMWSTNGLAADGTKTPDQFTVSYYTANAAYSSMSSSADSVEKNQATAYLKDNALTVDYRLGDFSSSYEDVPNEISNKRFEEKILSKLSDEEKADIKTYYKFYSSSNTWKIKSKGRNNFEDILKYMEKVGYTEKDLEKDNKEAGIGNRKSASPHFRIALRYELTKNGFSVSVPTEYIEYTKEYPLYEIKLLPCFGLVSQAEDGYVLLPDGCGALMKFAKDQTNQTEISIPVYGVDSAVASDVFSSNQYYHEEASLPVYGMVDGQSAYYAVISGAMSRAKINAHRAGTFFERNSAYTSFRMINKDSIYLSGSDNSSKVILFEKELDSEVPSVDYILLPHGSGYSDMANAYRNRLLKSNVLKPLNKNDSDTSLLIETIGGVKKQKNKFGISYVGLEKATSYSDNIKIAADLLDNGVKALDLKLICWFNGGVYHKYPNKVSLENTLGGKKGWQSLLNYAKENNISLYPDVDFQRINGMALGFYPSTSSSRRLDKSEAKYTINSRATMVEKSDIGLTPSSLFMLSPSRLKGLTNSFISSFSKYKTDGLSLRSVKLYSDFNDSKSVTRTKAQKIIEDELKALSGSSRLMADSSYQYLYPFVEKLSGVPCDSSRYKGAEETVPFLQAVLHGNKRLYTAPVNLSSNSKVAVLKAIEYGMNISYQITYEDSDILKSSEYTDNFSSGYSRWRKNIDESSNTVSEALNGLMSCNIASHSAVKDGVYKTAYDNGEIVYVNYNDDSVTVDGVSIEPNSYYRKSGGVK